jgi:hypothetical protein
MPVPLTVISTRFRLPIDSRRTSTAAPSMLSTMRRAQAYAERRGFRRSSEAASSNARAVNLPARRFLWRSWSASSRTRPTATARHVATTSAPVTTAPLMPATPRKSRQVGFRPHPSACLR